MGLGLPNVLSIKPLRLLRDAESMVFTAVTPKKGNDRDGSVLLDVFFSQLVVKVKLGLNKQNL